MINRRALGSGPAPFRNQDHGQAQPAAPRALTAAARAAATAAVFAEESPADPAAHRRQSGRRGLGQGPAEQ